MAWFDMSVRVSFLTVFVLIFLSSGWTGSKAEPNITFYAKERGKALKGIIKQLITDYKRLGLANGKISNELAAFGGLQNLPANNAGLSPHLQGFVSPSNDGSKQSVPSDQSSEPLGLSAVQNITAAQGTLPMNGGFTQWTGWSKCPVSCGRTALRSRERYCTNPAPANGGKNCEGPRFQLKLCKMKECPVEGGYTEWSEWSKCSNKCGTGMKHRYRRCSNPTPLNGGRKCFGKRKQVVKCHGKMCNDQNSVVDIDPQTVCGYDPCSVAKCISMPYATCVSDFKCKPVFFDSEEKRVDSCRGTELYLTINPDSVCRFNPCKYTTCMTSAPAKCVVNTKCQPVFLNAFGKRMTCKGVFKVPARYICGHNPCSSAMCKSEPSARCLVDHECKPVFVNMKKNIYKQCSERGQIVKAHPHNMHDDEDDNDNGDDDGDDDDPLRQLMKRKHRKNKEQEGDENEEIENKDDGEEQDDNMAEKKSKIKIPARFIGKR